MSWYARLVLWLIRPALELYYEGRRETVLRHMQAQRPRRRAL
jgi:hypothetical protein